MKSNVASRVLGILSVAMLFSGCSTLVTYQPQKTGPTQTVKYTQGVGTLSVRDGDQEIYMYPAFKTQGPGEPTFVIGYANNTTAAEEFSPENIKAYFRGALVPIYTYTEKVEQIRQEKLGKQVALAILGGAAAYASARAASKQTYTANYSGSAWGRGGRVGWAGSTTVRVYDPAAGMLAGAAVGGVTAVGITQLEYNAQNQELAADGILQANTVGPQQMVVGSLILKGCCDQARRADDNIRFEVTANGKVTAFQFRRAGLSDPSGPQQAVVAPSTPNVSSPPPSLVVPIATPSIDARIEGKAGSPVGAPVPTSTASISTSTSASTTPTTALQGGNDGYQVQQLAKSQSCSANPNAKLTAKGAGFETYVVTCANGDVVNYRCEFGNCRSLK